MTTQGNDYYVTASELRDVMSHLRKEKTYFIAGSHSIYVPRGPLRYMDKAVCKPWPDLHEMTRLVTPGQAARIELTREWPLLKRVGWPGGAIKLLGWRSPMHYTGQHVGHMIYVDLDSAYQQIYQKLWLDVAFPRSFYGSYPLSGVANRLEIWKAARNSLIGITRSTTSTGYKDGKRVTLKTKNKFLSPPLWATVQAVLHMVANRALRSGAIYVNVDGYIFPGTAWQFAEEFLDWISSAGFRWSIRAQGEGEIVSWNNYRIGTTRTKSYQLNLVHSSKEFSNVDNTDADQWESWWGKVRKIYETA